uniref:LON peptidase substrate-binding domain-containing protein n=1 Tax=Fulvivirga sp. TaxID=1931237 RepID=UPI00404A3C8B
MTEKNAIPIFPLNILPLPGELVPLHIFEPRYRQLLQDVEAHDIEFGIYFASQHNKERVGSLVRLESILKRYDTGESDIVVKCVDVFLLTKYLKRLGSKLYSGGDTYLFDTYKDSAIGEELKIDFADYLEITNSKLVIEDCDIHDIANALDLDNSDRLKYTKLISLDKKQQFLKQRLQYRKFIYEQELNHKNNFHLN